MESMDVVLGMTWVGMRWAGTKDVIVAKQSASLMEGS